MDYTVEPEMKPYGTLFYYRVHKVGYTCVYIAMGRIKLGSLPGPISLTGALMHSEGVTLWAP